MVFFVVWETMRQPLLWQLTPWEKLAYFNQSIWMTMEIKKRGFNSIMKSTSIFIPNRLMLFDELAAGSVAEASGDVLILRRSRQTCWRSRQWPAAIWTNHKRNSVCGPSDSAATLKNGSLCGRREGDRQSAQQVRQHS